MVKHKKSYSDVDDFCKEFVEQWLIFLSNIIVIRTYFQFKFYAKPAIKNNFNREY
jgi:hypothetical protein